MTAPLEEAWMRSLVIKPVSTEGSTRGQIVAGRGPKDTATDFWLPAGVHQLIIDFDEERWMSLYVGSRAVFGMDGPHKGRIVRVIMDKAGTVVPFVSTADPSNPTLLGITIFQVPA
ncbi:hypothetical protein [Corynebacterium sp. DNF00584]|uniref:hypothetical protein n=1 Tax=Corynebacterium sp. DNF00584 TaxID=1384076 RepID=UPI0012E3CDEC|nr:hypothetical protein [Corynebacterium sp. DNF00584]